MLRALCLLMIITASLCSSYDRAMARHRFRPRPGVMTIALPYKREVPTTFAQTLPLSPAPIHGFSSRSSLPIELFVPPFIAFEKKRAFRGFPMML